MSEGDVDTDAEQAPAAAPAADKDPPALEVRGLVHRFGEHAAVAAVDLDVTAGEVFGLLGPNGAGKTTTIRVVTTLVPVQEGEVRVFGTDVSRHPMRARRAIGYVPQQLSADAALSGRENVALFARLFDLPRRRRRVSVDEALAAMGLTEAADRLAGTYSGGMVRRLELAQALVSRPRLLILDEPTIGLDPIARESVWERVQQLQQATGMTVLLTTHYMEEADALCDRVALMHRGTIRALGSPEALKSDLAPGASLEDVFRHYAGDGLTRGGSDAEEGGFSEARRARRAASRG